MAVVKKVFGEVNRCLKNPLDTLLTLVNFLLNVSKISNWFFNGLN